MLFALSDVRADTEVDTGAADSGAADTGRVSTGDASIGAAESGVDTGNADTVGKQGIMNEGSETEPAAQNSPAVWTEANDAQGGFRGDAQGGFRGYAQGGFRGDAQATAVWTEGRHPYAELSGEDDDDDNGGGVGGDAVLNEGGELVGLEVGDLDEPPLPIFRPHSPGRNNPSCRRADTGALETGAVDTGAVLRDYTRSHSSRGENCELSDPVADAPPHAPHGAAKLARRARVPAWLLVGADVISGFSSGLSVRYFPLYFKEILSMGPLALNGLYVVTPLLTAVANAAFGRLARAAGQAQTALFARALSLSCLVAIILVDAEAEHASQISNSSGGGSGL